MNKLHIAIRLIQLLNENKKIDSKLVATRLDVSLRTAQRYLLDISAMPFVICDEEKSSYSLAGDYSLNDSLLNAAEHSLVSAIIDYASTVVGTEYAPPLQKIKKKIASINDIYHILQGDSIDLERVEPVRLPLEEAIRAGEMVIFHYSRYDCDYTVTPYRLLFAGGFWYLLADDSGVMKKFLLDFIEELSRTGRQGSAAPENLQAMLKEARTAWFGSGDPVRVVVEFDAEVAHFFRRKRFFPGQEIVVEKDDGALIIAMTVANEMDFFEQVARWFPYFRIIEPAGYREFIRDQAKTAMARNEEQQVTK